MAGAVAEAGAAEEAALITSRSGRGHMRLSIRKSKR